MKSFLHIFGFFLIIGITSCDKLIEERYYTANVPIYMSYEELRAPDAIQSQLSRSLEEPGKIYVYNNYLIVCEQQQGVHIIDNSNPSAPQKLSFVSIPGVMDIAVKSNVLYADSYTDLVAIDISNPSQVALLNRQNNVFKQAVFPDYDPMYPLANLDFNKGVVVGWKVEDVKEVYEGGMLNQSNSNSNFAAESGGSSNKNAGFSNQGTSGSMARFIVYTDYLYTLQTNTLSTFDISSPSSPVNVNDLSLNRVAETLFPYEDKLFMGTTTGMLVYDLKNPVSPVYLSDFNHAESCDPVVVENGIAYVTLRSGSRCGGWTNQLDVIDVNNIHSPFLIKSYQMVNPMGLGIENNVLFICDGTDGLKIYDATDKNTVTNNMLAHFSGIVAYDVIPLNGLLMLTGEQGIYQYDFTDVNNIQYLSVIPVE